MSSTLRSLAAPAVAVLLEVPELLLLVVLLDTVEDGAGVVCEPAPDPVDGAGELVTEEPVVPVAELEDWSELGVDDPEAIELEVSVVPELPEANELELAEAGPEVVSDSRGTEEDVSIELVKEDAGRVLEVVMPPPPPELLKLLEVVMPLLLEALELLELGELPVVEGGTVEDSVGLDATEELDSVVVAVVLDKALEVVELLDAAVLAGELTEEVVESVGVTTGAVVPVDCAEVTCEDVVDESAAGPLLVGDVASVALQKL